jgi:D-lactate dehydrogenase
MGERMLRVAVYDTKQYDKDFLSHASESKKIEWNFYDFRLNKNTKESAKEHDAVCVFVNDQVDRECLEAFSQYGIRLIALRCAGFNNVDLDSARQFNISVSRVPAYSPNAVAEHAVGLLLTLNRKIHRSYNRVREMNFSLHGFVGFDISKKTVGVIGTGKIGKVFAKILKGFDAKVIAYDVNPDIDWAKEYAIAYVENLSDLLKQSDIISLHVPLLPDTFHLINEETISQMKTGVVLINTSRGKVIDTHATIDALKKGYIGGLALDTYEEEEGLFFEDLSDKILLDDELSRLLTFPNVLITAHQAFLTKEALHEISKITVENLFRLAHKMPLLPETQL